MLVNIIETHELCYSYTAQKNEIKNLSLQVPKGSVFGFLGSNGSGKTTTIKLLLGLLKSSSGQIEIFKDDIKHHKLKILDRTGSLIESPSLYNHLNALDHLKLVARYKGKAYTNSKLEEFLEIVNLHREKMKKTSAFSMGMKQRLGVAMALIGNPELLILDEPINGLDPVGIIEMRNLIKKLNSQLGVTVFISSHILSEIEKTCTHLGVIRSGEILYQGTLADFKNISQQNIPVEFEISETEKAIALVEKRGFSAKISDTNTLLINFNNKEHISSVIDALRQENLHIYQIINRKDMESLFIELTQQ
ncbi:MAG: ABC transporter ATP-binding protein [Bacteroidetes bacterium]|nr:ABC transporter ATP-binding protein [Bacteroidota bacterium]